MQLLVENNKDLDLRNSLELAAEVQPFKIDSSTLDDVSLDFLELAAKFFYGNIKLECRGV